MFAKQHDHTERERAVYLCPYSKTMQSQVHGLHAPSSIFDCQKSALIWNLISASQQYHGLGEYPLKWNVFTITAVIYSSTFTPPPQNGTFLFY